jgi:hypothetical protein
MKLTEKSALVRFFNTIVLPQSQAIVMVIVALVAFTVAYRPYTRFISLEPEINVVPITPQKIKDWGGVPARVTVGLYINNFPTLDFVNNDFIFDGILWFEFDPALISLNTVSKFSFERGEILSMSEPYTQIIDNKFFARYTLRARFKSELVYKLFPFEGHRLDIVLINRTIQPSEMIFRTYASFFVISDAIKLPGWYIFDKSIKSGMVQSILDKYEVQKEVSYPLAVFSIDLHRAGTRNLFLILLPLFMLYFISLFCFAFNPETHSGTIFSLASAGVTGLLSYRFVIEGMTPKVGYFVLSDRLFVLFLAASLIEFVLAVIIVRFGKLTPVISIMRGITYILINIVFLVAWTYFFNKY